MNQWSTNFSSQKLIEKLEEIVSSFETASLETLTEPYVSRYARLQKVTRLLLEYYRAVDPDIVAADQVNNAVGQIEQIRNNCIAFAQNRNVGHIDNANNHVDALLTHIPRIIPQAPASGSSATVISTESILTKAFELSTKHKTEIDAQSVILQRFDGVISQLQSRIDEATRTIDQQKARLDQAIAEFQKQFSAAESVRSEGFNSGINQNQERFNTQRKEFEAQFATSAGEQRKAFETHLASVSKESDAHLEHLQKRKAEVDQIFGAIGSASLSGNFKQTADENAKHANQLRWIALGLMAGMIAIGGITYYESIVHPELGWQVFAFRLATVIVIAIPAVYAAQESSKHRERERKNRKLEMELATIDAYLVLLPKNKQDELKEKLTERFFGREETTEKIDDVTKHALFEVLKSAVNNLTKSK